MQVKIQFNADVPVKIRKKKKWFLAECPVLDVVSQGDTPEKARENLGETLSLFFTSCFERGVLEDVLKDCGFKAVHGPVKPASTFSPPEDYISVPIPFLVDQKSECRV